MKRSLLAIGLTIAIIAPAPLAAQQQVEEFRAPSEAYTERLWGGLELARMNPAPRPAQLQFATTPMSGLGIPFSRISSAFVGTDCLLRSMRTLPMIQGRSIAGSRPMGRPWGFTAGLQLSPFRR